MNRKRRERNRVTAGKLNHLVHEKKKMEHVCENCGERGGHWVAYPYTLQDILDKKKPDGYWRCKNVIREESSSMLMSAPQADESLTASARTNTPITNIGMQARLDSDGKLDILGFNLINPNQ